MITLITGGSKCGKSRLAENLLEQFAGPKIYVATMQPFGVEASAAIDRHRRLRAGKGFDTVEKYTDLHELSIPDNCGVLLECVGNLCANEMFRSQSVSYPAERIAESIIRLGRTTAEFVAVTNQVGCDGISYEQGTADYIRQLGIINSLVASEADRVIECVYGVPVMLKGVLPC